MEKITIEEYGKRVGISRMTAYRRSRAGRIFLDKVRGKRGQVFYLWDEKKALKGLTPIKNNMSSELVGVSVALSALKKRVDNIINRVVGSGVEYNIKVISNNKK